MSRDSKLRNKRSKWNVSTWFEKKRKKKIDKFVGRKDGWMENEEMVDAEWGVPGEGKKSVRIGGKFAPTFDLDRVNLARHESCHRFYDKISLGTVWRHGKLTEDISYRLSRSSHRISLFSVCGFVLPPLSSLPLSSSSSIAFSLIIKLKDVAGDVAARSGTFKIVDPNNIVEIRLRPFFPQTNLPFVVVQLVTLLSIFPIQKIDGESSRRSLLTISKQQPSTSKKPSPREEEISRIKRRSEEKKIVSRRRGNNPRCKKIYLARYFYYGILRKGILRLYNYAEARVIVRSLFPFAFFFLSFRKNRCKKPGRGVANSSSINAWNTRCRHGWRLLSNRQPSLSSTTKHLSFDKTPGLIRDPLRISCSSSPHDPFFPSKIRSLSSVDN